MNILTLKALPATVTPYKNRGQRAEQIARFTLTGNAGRADNISHTVSADCLDVQIKSARATVCSGTTNIEEYLATDAAKRYAYVSEAMNTMFIMTRAEYLEFARTFGTVTRESHSKGGGKVKVRLGHETKALMQWLRDRA